MGGASRGGDDRGGDDRGGLRFFDGASDHVAPFRP